MFVRMSHDSAEPDRGSNPAPCHYPGCHRPCRRDPATGRPSRYCEQSDPEGGPVHNRANARRRRREPRPSTAIEYVGVSATETAPSHTFDGRIAHLQEKLAALGTFIDKLGTGVRSADMADSVSVEPAHGRYASPSGVSGTAHPGAAPEMARQTERWFVRHGMPTMIEGYSFTEHVLPRMLPSLALMASLASLVWLVPLGGEGTWRWRYLIVVIAVIVTVRLAAGFVHRKLPRFSRMATIALLVIYAALPVVVPVVQFVTSGTVTPPGGHVAGAVGFVIFFVVAFIASHLAATYSLGALLGRAVRSTVFDMRNSVRRLLGWALPLLLIANVFLFFTGELWQAMNALPWWRLWLVAGMFGTITIVAAANRLREEISRVEQEFSLERLSAAVVGTPVATVSIDELARDRELHSPPLNGRQQRNLLVMLASRQLAQAGVVAVALLFFFIILGLIVVMPQTAALWIGSPPIPSRIPGVPVALFRNATLFAAFSAMLFAVTSMSDDEYRRQFFAPIIEEIESTLAVRTIYLAVRMGPGGIVNRERG
jgi:hypothetical protein